MKIRFDNPLFEFINVAIDYAILNIIFIICCIPIFTIGPSIKAMYQVMLRENRGEHGYLIRNYFSYFKESFMKSMLLFLGYFAITLLLLFSANFWYKLGNNMGTIFAALSCIFLFVLAISSLYVFALLARFENTIKQTVKNSLLIGLCNLFQSIIMVAIIAIIVVLNYNFRITNILMLLIGFSFIFYLNSFIMTKIFKTFENKE